MAICSIHGGPLPGCMECRYQKNEINSEQERLLNAIKGVILAAKRVVPTCDGFCPLTQALKEFKEAIEENDAMSFMRGWMSKQ